MTLLPNFLRLTLRVATASPRLLPMVWLAPYLMGFPPIKHCTLIWTHQTSHIDFAYVSKKFSIWQLFSYQDSAVMVFEAVFLAKQAVYS